jgi:hypothetical protein
MEINWKGRNTRNINKTKGQEEFVSHEEIHIQAWAGN